MTWRALSISPSAEAVSGLEDAAATKLQSHFRGGQARADVKARRAAGGGGGGGVMVWRCRLTPSIPRLVSAHDRQRVGRFRVMKDAPVLSPAPRTGLTALDFST
jgi:hypothetical protein